MISYFSKFFSKSTWLLFAVVPFLSGCLYEAPDEDHLHEIPTTNNPSITRETTKLNMPM